MRAVSYTQFPSIVTSFLLEPDTLPSSHPIAPQKHVMPPYYTISTRDFVAAVIKIDPEDPQQKPPSYNIPLENLQMVIIYFLRPFFFHIKASHNHFHVNYNDYLPEIDSPFRLIPNTCMPACMHG